MKQEYSVLMAVYEKENAQYFEEAILSILNQTVKTNDFVLVCDGPLTDELDDVIEKYNTEMNIIRLKKNVGLGNALNVGLKQCKNDLVARMDSDDISVLNRCEKQLQAFNDNPKLDFLSGTIGEFEDSPQSIIGMRKLPCQHADIVKYSKKRCPFNHPCIMFKKSSVLKAGGYNGEYRMEDYFLWIRMLINGCIGANLEDIILFMRTTPDMYMRRGGSFYAKDMLKFHWWVHKSGWASLNDFFTGAIPHAIVCILPNRIRGFIYKKLHN